MALDPMTLHERTCPDKSTRTRGLITVGGLVPLLHGAAGFWDDLIGFIGILVVIGGLLLLTWRAGKKKRQRLRGRGRRGRR
jgi:hypothetical protein